MVPYNRNRLKFAFDDLHDLVDRAGAGGVSLLPPPPLDGASAAAATSRDFWRPSLLQNGLTGLLVAIIINGWRLRTDTIKS